MNRVPAIVDGHFKLFQSHTILIYISCAFSGVASHWYPDDPSKRAKIHLVLEWYHLNLCRSAAVFVFNAILAPMKGMPLRSQSANEGEGLLVKSSYKLENFWLKDGRFLVGNSQPSIADLSLACEIMQFELPDEKDRNPILSPYKKVLKWIQDTKTATAPYFDEVHGFLFEAKKSYRDWVATESTNNELKSKL